jgi:hypothetical protein
MLQVGLRLARDLMGTPLPAPLNDWVDGDGEIAALTRTVSRRLLLEPERPPNAVEMYTFQLGLRATRASRWSDFGGIVRRAFLLSDRDRAAVPLPQGLGFLYYVIRPVRLLWGYGASLLKIPFRLLDK